MNQKLYCPFCADEREIIIKTVNESYPVKGEDIEITANVSICTACGNEIWNEDLDTQNLKNAFDVFRSKHGLLTPKQIKGIRDKYGISQTTFARALGLGEKTITRYERGSLQDRAHNGLISLADKPDAFKHLVELNKELLSESEFHMLIERLGAFRIKTIERTPSDGTVNYTNRSQYVYNVFPNYFGGLNNAG